MLASAIVRDTTAPPTVLAGPRGVKNSTASGHMIEGAGLLSSAADGVGVEKRRQFALPPQQSCYCIDVMAVAPGINRAHTTGAIR